MSLLSPSQNWSAATEIVALILRHRELTFEMTRRYLTANYGGQVLGSIWSIGHPLLLIAVYILIFSVVLKLRVGAATDTPYNYAVYLLSGIIPWLSVVSVLSGSAAAITSEANLVKQVVFPVEVLPIRIWIAALFNQFIYLTILILYLLIAYPALQWSWLLLVPLVVFQVLAFIGLSFVVSAVGVYVRDLKDVIQVFNNIGIFLVPIFFSIEMVPKYLTLLFYINPFSYLVWCFQDVFYYNRIEHPEAWAVWIVLSLALFSWGYRVFRRLKGMFGSVL